MSEQENLNSFNPSALPMPATSTESGALVAEMLSGEDVGLIIVDPIQKTITQYPKGAITREATITKESLPHILSNFVIDMLEGELVLEDAMKKIAAKDANNECVYFCNDKLEGRVQSCTSNVVYGTPILKPQLLLSCLPGAEVGTIQTVFGARLMPRPQASAS